MKIKIRKNVFRNDNNREILKFVQKCNKVCAPNFPSACAGVKLALFASGNGNFDTRNRFLTSNLSLTREIKNLNVRYAENKLDGFYIKSASR